MIAAFTGADEDERKTKEGATPWLKFLWDTYKTVLDILKNNARLEVLYQDVAKRGFKFCTKYSRGNEFRKICETLRSHLANLSRNQHRANQPGRHIQMSDLSNPDTVQLFLDTRFEPCNNEVCTREAGQRMLGHPMTAHITYTFRNLIGMFPGISSMFDTLPGHGV